MKLFNAWNLFIVTHDIVNERFQGFWGLGEGSDSFKVLNFQKDVHVHIPG